MRYRPNPTRQQNLVAELWPKFQQTGDVLWPPQRAIYKHIAAECAGTISDIGCGLGIGTSLLGELAVGWDLSSVHIDFARAMFGGKYYYHDITTVKLPRRDVVVCLEVVEHIDPALLERTIKNLRHSCQERVYLSTPNRLAPSIGSQSPLNDYHTREYFPEEIVKHLPGCTIRHPVTWKELHAGTSVTPLVFVWGRE